MKQVTAALFFVVILAAPSSAQERIKFPVGVSSKVMGYGHLWTAWRLKYFEREGLDAEVVMRGTAPAVQALIANSISVGLLANGGPIAAVEHGMDIAMIAGGSKITHMQIGAKNYKKLGRPARRTRLLFDLPGVASGSWRSKSTDSRPWSISMPSRTASRTQSAGKKR